MAFFVKASPPIPSRASPSGQEELFGPFAKKSEVSAFLDELDLNGWLVKTEIFEVDDFIAFGGEVN